MDGPSRKRQPLGLREEELRGQERRQEGAGCTQAVGERWPRGGAGPRPCPRCHTSLSRHSAHEGLCGRGISPWETVTVRAVYTAPATGFPFITHGSPLTPLCSACCMLSRVRLCGTPPWTVPARLLCPWDSPGKNTGVGCHFPPQGSSQPRDQTLSPAWQAGSSPSKPPGSPLCREGANQ